MKETSAIVRNFDHLPPGLLADIPGWLPHQELAKLIRRLDKSSEEQFLDSLTEVMVAKHLLDRACRLRVEVAARSGRSADFEVSRDALRFYVHVKHLTTDGRTQKHVRITRRLKALELIGRPLSVWVSLLCDPTDEDMQTFVKQADSFIKKGDVGDRLPIRNAAGHELGVCAIDRWRKGDHVSLTIGHPTRSSDGCHRPRERLRAAYGQFVEDAVNVIIVANGTWTEVAEDFSDALLGAERCTVAPGGTILALERLGDGFWSRGKHSESHVAAWFNPLPGWEGFCSKVWWREGHSLEPAMTRLLKEALEA